MVECPICGKIVRPNDINAHIDSACKSFIETGLQPPLTQPSSHQSKKGSVSTFFQSPLAKRIASSPASNIKSSVSVSGSQSKLSNHDLPSLSPSKRLFGDVNTTPGTTNPDVDSSPPKELQPSAKKNKTNPLEKVAPLAERMRPAHLDDIYGQDLVGPQGVLRALIEQDCVPSIILWGGAGTGKTTIARCIASYVNCRFVEINSTSSGIAECKKIFIEARNELAMTARKTLVFCDEIHRYSKAQQDVFLGPVESGLITLIGATTENPSFKVQAALLSRCRTFVLSKLTDDCILNILQRALSSLGESTELIDTEFLNYLSAFSDGDARTALNLLELALSLSAKPGVTKDDIKTALTKTFVYDRAGDQHYDTISAFHKSIRGSDPDAALYYLARMLQSGEDPLYIARRMVIIASEDVGLADNSMLSLATSAYIATEKIGMPECRISLAHAAVALCLAPKSTRSYRGLNNAYAALREPGVAALPIPISLRNAPTKLMKELGHGVQYKYNPNYKDGKVRQDYLPTQLIGRTFLEDRDLGTEIDPEAWS